MRIFTGLKFYDDDDSDEDELEELTEVDQGLATIAFRLPQSFRLSLIGTVIRKSNLKKGELL